jgi:hypothetical protein
MSLDGSEQSSDDPDFECGSSAGSSSSSSSSSLDSPECHDEESDCKSPKNGCGTNNERGSSSSCCDGSISDCGSAKESMTVDGISLQSDSPSAGSSVQGRKPPVKSRADSKQRRAVAPRKKDIPSSPSGSSSSDG